MQFLGLASFGLPELALGGPAGSTPLLGYRGGLAYSLGTAPCSEHLYSPAREAACAMCAHDQINSCQLSSTIFLPPGYLGTGSGSASTTATPLPPGSDILPRHRLRAFSGLGARKHLIEYGKTNNLQFKLRYDKLLSGGKTFVYDQQANKVVERKS
ncbi:hypothetical protein HPB52_024717 [Rhipicephalus sanguineus]|uniref:Uncharacterized protein n=1 Tax=Rhipicephalus sanguineus TaxID=34632 RepID=A0A9D4PBY7_RHISA|nr:hypothetical protein HPB52_024717 [Rhipicephalus sanguineus]